VGVRCFKKNKKKPGLQNQLKFFPFDCKTIIIDRSEIGYKCPEFADSKEFWSVFGDF